MARYGTDAKSTLALFGLSFNPNDPAAPLYKPIIAAHRPRGQRAGGQWDAVAEACMRARRLIYAEKTAGDCGHVSSSSSAGIINESAGLALSGAQLGESIASVSITSALGAATAGIGLALQPVLGLIEHHGKAVANEKRVLCGATAYVSQRLQAIDNAVRAGQISGAAGMSYIRDLATTFKGAVQPIFKSCNAACDMDAIMDCLVDQSAYIYGVATLPPGASAAAEISPLFAPDALSAPVFGARAAGESSPATVSATASPGVSVSGGLNLFGFMVPAWALLVLAVIFLIGVLT